MGRETMITEAEDFFAKGCGRCARFATPDCATRRWFQGLTELRRICRAAGLVEAVKWAHPCYMHAGRNIALINAFRADYRINFMNAGLLSDPAGLLERRGPNTRHPDMIRFTENGQVAKIAATLRAYLEEAKTYAEAGAAAPKIAAIPEPPVELIEVMDDDPELAEAFASLTPGRQRGYIMQLTAARKPATRFARIAKYRAKILAGKGALER